MKSANSFEFKNKNIIIVSPEPWEYIFVSKHHYAIELAKLGNRVYFINGPTSGVKEIKIEESLSHAGIFVVDYPLLLKGQRFLPGIIDRMINRSFFRHLEKKANCRFDVFINFENSRFYDFRFLPANVFSIYFQVDENQDFHPLIAAKTANITFAINETIKDNLLTSARKVFKISHGFSGALSDQAKAIIEGQYNYQPVLGNRLTTAYVGNIDNNYINQDLLIKLVNAYPGISFILYGPYSTKGKVYLSLHGNTNVIFKGKIPSQAIASELAKADLLFYLYIDSFKSSSHKVLEYLASGKAIVGNYFNEYNSNTELIYFANNENYVSLFGKVASSIIDKNNFRLMKTRIEFAMANSYSRKIKEIETIINTHLFKL